MAEVLRDELVGVEVKTAEVKLKLLLVRLGLTADRDWDRCSPEEVLLGVVTKEEPLEDLGTSFGT